MTRGQDDQVACLWSSMSDLVLRQDRRRAVVDELGISFFRSKILRRLLGGPVTMRDLATILGTDKPQLSVTVDDLERRGLVTRSIHPDDRRVRLVTLTETGTAAAVRANEILAQPPQGLARLSAEDLATLDRLLAAIRSGDDPDQA